MKVIKYIDAAKIAGVSRQAIYDLKKINIEGKRRYPFFIFDPQTGNAGVNIEDNSWKDYLDRNRNNPVKKKALVNKTKSVISKAEQANSAVESNIIEAVVMALKEKFSISGKDLEDLLRLIDKKHEGIKK